MTTYFIGMQFVGWLIALLMLHGFAFIKFCERAVKDESLEDKIRMGAESIIGEYNSRNLGGRIALILYYSVKMLTGRN
jgi:hypothetical protein